MQNENAFEQRLADAKQEQLNVLEVAWHALDNADHTNIDQAIEGLITNIASNEERNRRFEQIQMLVMRLQTLGFIQPAHYNAKIKEIRKRVEEEVGNQQTVMLRPMQSIGEQPNGMYYYEAKMPLPITNFIIYPNYRVYTTTQSTNGRESTHAYAEFTVIIPQGHDKPLFSSIELQSYDFTSAAALKEAFQRQNVGAAFVFGTDLMVAKLGEYLFTKVKAPTKIGVTQLGIMMLNGQNLIVTPQQVYDVNGNVREDIVYDRNTSATGNEIAKLKGLNYDQTNWEEEVLPFFVEHVLNLHQRTAMMTLIGWLTSIGFETIIRKKGRMDGYPHVILVGVNGGGKSGVVITLMPYFGYGAESDLPGFTKKFGDLASASISYHIPTVRDEYRPSDWKETERNDRNNFIRDSYGKKSEDKGTKHLNTITYKYMNPLLMTGQQTPNDVSLLERMIVIPLDSNFINIKNLDSNSKEGLRAIHTHEAMNNNPNKDYWTGFLIWAARQDSDQVVSVWKEYVERFRQRAPGLKLREYRNYATVPLGLQMFKRMAEEYGLDCGFDDSDIEGIIGTVVQQARAVLGEKKDELREFFEDLDGYIGAYGNKNANMFGDGCAVRFYQPGEGKADVYGKSDMPAYVCGRKVLLVNVRQVINAFEKDKYGRKHNEQMLRPILLAEFERTKHSDGDGLVLAPDGYRTPDGKRYTAFNWEFATEYFSSLESTNEAQSSR